MSRLQTISETLSDEVWRYAIIAGLASTLFTIILYWQSYPDFSHPVSPVFFAGLLVGFLANRRGIEAGQIGKRTGLVAALPVLWPFLDLLVFISGLSQPLGFSGFQIMAVIFISVVSIGVSVLVGMVGAILGDWLTGKIGDYRLLNGQLAT
ncbi:DUF5518 domain-containing protein [Halostagnicola sp. A-GB9-2]|uniref:DUF5518 domain-containing protein n=1 Tax=Halostagnicola sp. A-GB9-2 TaxID=3048066 RepID=UPI0024BFC400|nr:DUF5518 domain-containing protein [Halostagnicola sp. A-GB9-2]MDJ1434172.1 DUF5518 domain-containing protein [Halostagnicola sp. A-GB9-2]